MNRRDVSVVPGIRAVSAAMTTAWCCALLFLVSAPAYAAANAPSGLVALSLKGPGSLTGVWSNPAVAQSSSVKTEDGRPIPYLPRIAELMAQKGDAKSKAIDAQSAPWCRPQGLPTMMEPPPNLPLQFLETPRQITVLFGDFGTFRFIYLNEKHPPDPDPGYFGHSVGHWMGDSLIVDTIALSEKAMLFGAPHGENMHVVERIRRIDADTLENRITIEDPTTYTRPWTWVITLKRVAGSRITEYQRKPC
jgi:hypothetical protein